MVLEGLRVENWHLRGERSHLGLHRVEHLVRFSSRARNQNHVRTIVLEQRQGEELPGGLGQAAALKLFCDGPDFGPVLSQVYPSSDTLPLCPVASRQAVLARAHTL